MGKHLSVRDYDRLRTVFSRTKKKRAKVRLHDRMMESSNICLYAWLQSLDPDSSEDSYLPSDRDLHVLYGK